MRGAGAILIRASIKMIMKKILFSALVLTLAVQAQAQKSKPEGDSAALVRELGEKACGCIDSLNRSGTLADKPEATLKAIAGCIDDAVPALQLGLQLAGMDLADPKAREIRVDLSKESATYKNNYYKLERWLKDNCAVMTSMVATNDVVREKSFSNNKDAMKAYNEGVRLMQAENYKQAIPFFEKAVGLDPEFVFAWDNLGVSYRRTNDFGKAESAYKASLQIDPKGRTALMNLPVVYHKQQKNEEAIAAYRRLLEVYNDDPESYYGIALVYLENKKDHETALPYICKAYNLYVEQRSPYRSDAEKLIGQIYRQMKAAGKEEAFFKVLKEHNISAN